MLTCLGQVFSAGLDVYENEPSIEPGLVNNPRVMLLPHIGTTTFETQRDMELLVLENLRSCLATGKLVTLVPDQHEALYRSNSVGASKSQIANGNGFMNAKGNIAHPNQIGRNGIHI